MQAPGELVLAPGMKTQTLGMDYKVAALVGYIIPIVAWIIAATEPKEPQRAWMRFHAFQATFTSIAAAVLLNVLSIGLGMVASILTLVVNVLWLVYLVVMILAGLKANKGGVMKLPVVGDLAMKYT